MEQDGGAFMARALGAHVPDVLGDEEFLIEALRDVLKDEVKRSMRQELEANPELKEELVESVREYFVARVRQNYATLKLAKASAKLGVDLMPDDLRDDLGNEFVGLIEKEVTSLLDKAL